MSEPIRVLCVLSSLERGGIPSVVMNLYRNIDRSVVQFDFVKHSEPKGEYEDEVRLLGGRIYNAPRFQLSNYVSYRNWWRSFLTAHPEYLIIHGHYYTTASVYLRFCQEAGRTTILHSHSTDVNGSGWKRRIKTIFSKRGKKYANVRIACSNDAGNWLYGKSPFTVLYNAIDLEKYRFQPEQRSRVREELGFGDGYVIGAVGRLEQVKNPLGIISVFKETVRQMPETKLLWIGEGTQRPLIEQTLEQEGLRDRTVLTGSRDDVHLLMQAMDCFILPSFHEGLPVTAIEAQTSGLPCLCSDRVSREAAVSERCAFLPLDQPQAWAEMICKSNRTCRTSAVPEMIEQNYDISKTAKRAQDLYIRLSGLQ